MKKYYFFALSLLVMTFTASCSDNKQKQQETKIEKVNSDAVEKARQDSLRQKAREDSLEQVRKDSIAVAEKKAKELQNFNVRELISAGRTAKYAGILPTMGYKTGPSYQSEESNYEIFYKDCTVDKNGNVVKLSDTGTPVKVTIGSTMQSFEGYISIEVFSKEVRDIVKQKINSYVKQEYHTAAGRGVDMQKTKLGWEFTINYGFIEGM